MTARLSTSRNQDRRIVVQDAALSQAVRPYGWSSRPTWKRPVPRLNLAIGKKAS